MNLCSRSIFPELKECRLPRSSTRSWRFSSLPPCWRTSTSAPSGWRARSRRWGPARSISTGPGTITRSGSRKNRQRATRPRAAHRDPWRPNNSAWTSQSGECHESLSCGFVVRGDCSRGRVGVAQHHPATELGRIHHRWRPGRRSRPQPGRAKRIEAFRYRAGAKSRQRNRPLSVPNASAAWPVEIRLAKDRRTLHVTFDDGKAFSLSAELLRVTSPSAEVQGHSEAQRKTVGGKRNVTILSVDAVGNYAVRLGFDDMHTTGIYSWAFLRDLGQNAERRFQDYLDDLQAKGLDRDRPGMR